MTSLCSIYHLRWWLSACSWLWHALFLFHGDGNLHACDYSTMYIYPLMMLVYILVVMSSQWRDIFYDDANPIARGGDVLSFSPMMMLIYMLVAMTWSDLLSLWWWRALSYVDAYPHARVGDVLYFFPMIMVICMLVVTYSISLPVSSHDGANLHATNNVILILSPTWPISRLWYCWPALLMMWWWPDLSLLRVILLACFSYDVMMTWPISLACDTADLLLPPCDDDLPISFACDTANLLLLWSGDDLAYLSRLWYCWPAPLMMWWWPDLSLSLVILLTCSSHDVMTTWPISLARDTADLLLSRCDDDQTYLFYLWYC